MSEPILRVQDLRVSVGAAPIVRGVSFDVAREQTVGIVGAATSPGPPHAAAAGLTRH